MGGLIATILGMAIFSNASPIANFFSSAGTQFNHYLAISIAIFAFCVLDLAINTTMWPVRALQGDLIPGPQQHSIQSASIVMFSLGDLAASALLDSFEEPVSHIRLIFLIAGSVYAITVFSLLFLGKEQRMYPNDPQLQQNSEESNSVNIFQYLQSLPAWMWCIGLTHALGFFSLFCFLPNTSSWLGSTVLGGDPDAPAGSPKQKLYGHGVTVYGKASMFRSAIQIIYSAVYPYLLYVISPGQLMCASFGVFGVLLMIAANTTSVRLAQSVVVSMALPIAAHFTLPVGLTVQNSDVSNRGRFLGALNCFAVMPQLIDTAYV